MLTAMCMEGFAERARRELLATGAWPSCSSAPRTVEWHLGSVFTKLGITSRKDLR
jgi:hypothetical protein